MNRLLFCLLSGFLPAARRRQPGLPLQKSIVHAVLALEAALGRCEIHGHRGHVESDRNSFSKNWAEK